MRDFKWARALNQEERREKASYAKDCVCCSPEASKVVTGRAQEDEKHAGTAEDGSQWESAEHCLGADPVLCAGVGKAGWSSSLGGMHSSKRDGNLDFYIIVTIITKYGGRYG